MFFWQKMTKAIRTKIIRRKKISSKFKEFSLFSSLPCQIKQNSKIGQIRLVLLFENLDARANSPYTKIATILHQDKNFWWKGSKHFKWIFPGKIHFSVKSFAIADFSTKAGIYLCGSESNLETSIDNSSFINPCLLFNTSPYSFDKILDKWAKIYFKQHKRNNNNNDKILEKVYFRCKRILDDPHSFHKIDSTKPGCRQFLNSMVEKDYDITSSSFFETIISKREVTLFVFRSEFN